MVDVAHFFIWLVALGAVPVLLLWVAARRLPLDRPLAQLNLWAGPALLAAVWLHGVLFDPPNNWAVLRDGSMTSYAPDGTVLSSSRGMTFLEFWFKRFRDIDWSPERRRAALWLAAPAMVCLAVALLRAWRARRQYRFATGETRGALGYLSWVVAALLLHHIPDVMMDVPDAFLGDRDLSPGLLREAAGTPLLLAAIPLLVAVLLARLPRDVGAVRPR